MIRLTSEREYLVLDNLSIVHYVLHKMKIYSGSVDYEDIVSVGTIGLVKAASSFDESMGIKFSTYAIPCIRNELLCYFRDKKRKELKCVSLDEPIKSKESSTPLGNFIPDKMSEAFIKRLEEQDVFLSILNIILNCSVGKSRLVFLYRLSGWSNSKIANELGCSSWVASTLYANGIKKIKECFENRLWRWGRSYHVAQMGSKYRITFFSTSPKHLKKILSALHAYTTTKDRIPFTQYILTERKVTIEISACQRAYLFLVHMVSYLEGR